MARHVVSAFLALVLRATAASAFQPTPPEGFVPVTGAPVTEQIPAAPLVIAAYGIFLVLMVFYVWTIWRRMGKVEADLRALEHRQERRERGR